MNVAETFAWQTFDDNLNYCFIKIVRHALL